MPVPSSQQLKLVFTVLERFLVWNQTVSLANRPKGRRTLSLGKDSPLILPTVGRLMSFLKRILLEMNELNAWAPYLNNPLTLAAFVVLVVAAVFLSMLKARTSLKLQSFVASAFIVVSLGTLALAIFSEYKRKVESPKIAASQPALAGTTNIQMVRGSNNVLVNQSEKSK